jgi:hypothetical protein
MISKFEVTLIHDQQVGIVNDFNDYREIRLRRGVVWALCYRAGMSTVGMSTAKRAVAARMAERRAARADRRRGRHHPEGPEGEPPVIRPLTGELRQIFPWVRRHYQAAQAVLVVMAMTLTALALQIVRWVRRHYWAVQAVLVVMALTLAAFGLTGLLGFWSP